MTKFRVIVNETNTVVYEIEADNEDQLNWVENFLVNQYDTD